MIQLHHTTLLSHLVSWCKTPQKKWENARKPRKLISGKTRTKKKQNTAYDIMFASWTFPNISSLILHTVQTKFSSRGMRETLFRFFCFMVRDLKVLQNDLKVSFMLYRGIKLCIYLKTSSDSKSWDNNWEFGLDW